MQIISVQPKDIHITLEMSMKEVRFLLDFLSRSKLEYTEEEKEWVEFVTKDFFPKLNELEEKIKDGT